MYVNISIHLNATCICQTSTGDTAFDLCIIPAGLFRAAGVVLQTVLAHCNAGMQVMN